MGPVTYLEKVAEEDAPEAPAVDKFSADPDTYGEWISRDAAVTLSSTSEWDTPGQRDQLVQANRPEFAPAYAFHTGEAAHPWVQIDLGAVRDVKAVSIWNRAEVGDRAAGLTVQVSRDGEQWTDASDALDVAGQWEVEMPDDTEARYVRLRVAGEAPTYLHLKHVRVYGE